MDPFATKLLLSGIIGGAVVGGCTMAGERAGGRIGGFIGGLPSVVMVVYLSIAWTQGTREAYAATTSFPLTYAIMALCVFVYVVLRLDGLAVSIFSFLGLWFLLQTVVVVSGVQSYQLALAIWITLLTIMLAYLWKGGATMAARAAGTQPKRMALATRVAIGGSVIMTAVLLSKLGGPNVGSVFAAFPGIFLSTLFIAHRNVGVDFSRSLLAPMLVSGMINCIAFVAVFRMMLLDFGVAAATSAAIIALFASGYVSGKIINHIFSPDSDREDGRSGRHRIKACPEVFGR
jgi:uncharacterized protein DUF3147